MYFLPNKKLKNAKVAFAQNKKNKSQLEVLTRSEIAASG